MKHPGPGRSPRSLRPRLEASQVRLRTVRRGLPLERPGAQAPRLWASTPRSSNQRSTRGGSALPPARQVHGLRAPFAEHPRPGDPSSLRSDIANLPLEDPLADAWAALPPRPAATRIHERDPTPSMRSHQAEANRLASTFSTGPARPPGCCRSQSPAGPRLSRRTTLAWARPRCSSAGFREPLRCTYNSPSDILVRLGKTASGAGSEGFSHAGRGRSQPVEERLKTRPVLRRILENSAISAQLSRATSAPSRALWTSVGNSALTTGFSTAVSSFSRGPRLSQSTLLQQLGSPTCGPLHDLARPLLRR